METKSKKNQESASSKEKVNGEIRKINVLVSGLPGNMATLMARKVLQQKDMYLIRSSLTGDGVLSNLGGSYSLDNIHIHLDEPPTHKEALEALDSQYNNFINIDFVAPIVKGQPSPARRNAELYCSLKRPFVMGSTTSTEDVEAIKKQVVQSGNIAVYGPNMAVPIIIFQDMMQYAANKYPGALKGYLTNLVESHQVTKKDTSGTMKAVIKDIQKLGIDASEDDILMIRDLKEQKEVVGIPKEFLGGHAYHWYHLISQDQTARLSFSHCVDGRDVYAQGALAAIRFLNRRIQEGVVGKVYSMIDVLSEGASNL
jgi:4-hydroxy-tetrahydrodipicolinate reductase